MNIVKRFLLTGLVILSASTIANDKFVVVEPDIKTSIPKPLEGNSFNSSNAYCARALIAAGCICIEGSSGISQPQILCKDDLIKVEKGDFVPWPWAKTNN